jgi:sugar phosphate isomerase/epimerase
MNRRMFVKAFPAFTALVGTASGFAHHPKSPVDGGKSVPAAPQVKEAVRNFGSDPHPDIIVGALSNQNWHRQIRRLGLDAAARLDYMIKKTAAIGKEFGFSPLSMDLGVAGLPSTDKAYLDELKARLAENKLWPVAGVGGVAVSYDDEVRSAALNTGRRNLEVAAYLGARTCTFSPQMNGRVTHMGRIRLATQSVRELGKAAKNLGLRICQENFDYFTSDDLIRISKGTGLDNVGILNDNGNWLILNEDPVFATKKCLPLTFHAHVRVYVLENGVYNGVALGRGLVDFPTLLPILARAGAKERLVFSVELDTDSRDEDEEVHESYRYLKAWLVANGLMT